MFGTLAIMEGKKMGSHRLHVARKRRREVLREKIILITIAALIAVCFSIIIGTKLVRAQDEIHTSQSDIFYGSIEITSGDTLWDIAKTYTEGTEISVSEYVDQLKTMNKISDETIYAGQHLTIAYYK